MSTVKISELPVLASADAADEFVVVDDSAGVTKKITQAGLADFGSNTLTAAGITLGASTLDDYEEGTWTPVYEGSGANPSGSYTTQEGFYIKVGPMVFVQFRIRGGATSSTGSGAIRVGNLPFPCLNLGFNVGGQGVGFAINFDEAPISVIPLNGTSQINLIKKTSTSALSGSAELLNSDLRTGSGDNLIIGALQYQTS